MNIENPLISYFVNIFFVTETLIIMSHYLKLHECNSINIMSMRDCISLYRIYQILFTSYLRI